MAPAAGASLAASHRVVDGILRHAALVRPPAEPAAASRLAEADVLVLQIRHLPHRGAAIDVHFAHLGRAQADRRVETFASDELRRAARAPRQLSAATGKSISVQDVLQLGTAVEEDVLFRLCDTIVDRDVAGALVTLEELAERGLDLAQLTRDLLEHLRHLLLVQHLGHVPDSLPLTEESRERLREQANQLPEPTVVRLIDLLAVVLEDERQGGDPRLPLELALVKVTRPQSDLARESLVHRVEVLESRLHAGSPAAESWGPSPVPAPAAGPAPVTGEPESSSSPAPDVSLEQMQEAWTRSVLPAVKERSIPAATLLAEASPSGLEGDTLTLSFRPGAEFHRTQAEEPGYAQLLRDALYDVTGRRLAVVTAVADSAPDEGTVEDAPLGERGLIALLESDLDAREVEETS